MYSAPPLKPIVEWEFRRSHDNRSDDSTGDGRPTLAVEEGGTTVRIEVDVTRELYGGAVEATKRQNALSEVKRIGSSTARVDSNSIDVIELDVP